MGPFYPSNSKQTDFLRLYSSAYDTVEIDSSFYHIPNSMTMHRWYSMTPSSFVFAAKMPKQITHDSGFRDYEEILSYFLKSYELLKEKQGPVLVQLPPSLNHESGWRSLRSFLDSLPSAPKFAVEFRNKSFFNGDVYSYLESRNITLAWSEVPYVKSEPILTTDTVYLRLVGDRSIKETEFGKVVKDRTESVRRWAANIRSVEGSAERVFIFSNNHFQGFGPATVNLVRRELGLDEIDWHEKMNTSRPEGQLTLFDTKDQN